MKKITFFVLLVSLTIAAHAQQIPAWSADEVISHTSSKDTVYIINFWATWCVPCVQELPEFNSLYNRFAGKPVKVVMVSLDFKEDYPYKLASFLERKKLLPQVAWLTDTNPNVFIPKIENSWQGSIPATMIVSPGKQFRKFIEGTITERQVAKIVNEVMAQ